LKNKKVEVFGTQL